MLLIPHYVAASPIHGLGCFSAADVRQGERIWEYHPAIDRIISEADLETLPEHVAACVLTHAEYFPAQALFRLSADGDFYMNHSDDPNFDDHGDYALARRDIMKGEEITCDYRVVKVHAHLFAAPMPEENGKVSRDVKPLCSGRDVDLLCTG